MKERSDVKLLTLSFDELAKRLRIRKQITAVMPEGKHLHIIYKRK